jgi:hypothetical protein
VLGTFHGDGMPAPRALKPGRCPAPLYVGGFFSYAETRWRAPPGVCGRQPARASGRREVVSFAAGKEAWFIGAMLFALGALPLLGCFAAGLYLRLQQAGANAKAVLALIGGAFFALLFFVAVTIWMAPLVDVPEGRVAQLAQASTYLTIDDIGWVALGGGGVGAGLMVIAASLGALRAGAVPSWLGWVGVVFGVASFATITFFGMFAWVAGSHLAREKRAAGIEPA